MTASRLFALLFAPALLLAGCGGGDPPAPGADNLAAPAAPLPGANQADAAPADTAGQLEARARAALAPLVADAATAPLLGVRQGVGGAVCGEVGTGGGFRGFVAPPQGRPAIARSEGLDLTDIDDPYPPLYIRWCATSAELAALRPQLEGGGATPEADALAPADLAPIPAAPAPKAAPPPPRRPAPAPTGRFSDAVIRPDER